MTCAKTAVLIEMQSEMLSWIGPGNHVLDLDGGTHWRNLPNTIESSVCGGDAALCHIISTTCYNYCCNRTGAEVLQNV